MKFGNFFRVRESISRRTLMILLAVLLAQMALTGIISSRLIFSYIYSILDTKNRELNESLVEEINYIRNNYEVQADRIMANQTIQDVLWNGKTRGFAFLQFVEDRNKVEWFLMDRENKIHSILVGNGVVYQSNTASRIFTTYSDIISTDVYRKSLESRGGNIWYASQWDIIARKENPSIYLCKTINLIKFDYSPLAQLVMRVSMDTLDKVFARGKMAENEYYAIIDDDGICIYHTLDKSLIGGYLDESLRFDSARGDVRTIDSSSGSLTVYYSPYIRTIRGNGWNIVHAVPVSVTTEHASWIRNIVLLIMLTLLFMSIPLLLLLLGGITRPIVRLKETVNAFGNSLNIRAVVDRQDEIGSLQESFNRMADDIEKLLSEMDKRSKQLRRMELDALEYQVNPHFLYNSLDSINWMARKANNSDVSEMVTAMARFYRVGLSRGQEFYRVKDELEHARQYLMINKLRFKDSFDFRIDASQEIMDCQMLKIILQPIVENAIKHGIDKTSSRGYIKIEARQYNRFITFTVSDNGPGIQPNKLKTIKNKLTAPELDAEAEGGFGLYNTCQRLRLYYGGESNISIESGPEGTDVSVQIPNKGSGDFSM